MPGTTFDDIAVTIGAVTIGAERAKLEDRRARLEAKHAARVEIEAAVGRYRAICSGDPIAVRESGAPAGDVTPAGTPVPDDPPAPPGAPAHAPGGMDGPGAPAGGERVLPGGQEAGLRANPGEQDGRGRRGGYCTPLGAVTPPPAAPGSKAALAAAPRSSRGSAAASCSAIAGCDAAGSRTRGERRKPKAASDDPEPLEVLLQAPMPVVEEAAAHPAAPVRVGPERDYAGSRIANAPPIFEGRDLMRARMRDRAGDDRFVGSMLSVLSPEAKARAKDVRIKAGDPTAQLLG